VGALRRRRARKQRHRQQELKFTHRPKEPRTSQPVDTKIR
jgi:hypothetical protein